MSVVLFNARALVAGTFNPSAPVLLQGDHLVIDFTLVIGTAATQVRWYIEYAEDDPNSANTLWFRELAEEDNGGGQVDMPIVIRSFRDNGGANLPAATYQVSVQFVRKHKFARLQAEIVAGGGTCTMTAVERVGLPALQAS